MIHYTCDMCQKAINTQKEERFRVLIDIEQMRYGEDDSDLESDPRGQMPFEDFDPEPDGEDEFFHSFRHSADNKIKAELLHQ